jgi:hypothetical protein
MDYGREDEKLKDLVQTHDGKNWNAMARLVPGRTKLQCSVVTDGRKTDLEEFHYLSRLTRMQIRTYPKALGIYLFDHTYGTIVPNYIRRERESCRDQ